MRILNTVSQACVCIYTEHISVVSCIQCFIYILNLASQDKMKKVLRPEQQEKIKEYMMAKMKDYQQVPNECFTCYLQGVYYYLQRFTSYFQGV